MYPLVDMLLSGPEMEKQSGQPGAQSVPKAPRVSNSERGNLDLSAWNANPCKPSGPVTSQTRGRASVVVRARESRVHGEGRQ